MVLDTMTKEYTRSIDFDPDNSDLIINRFDILKTKLVKTDNIVLIWLDKSIDHRKKDDRNSINHLRQIVSSIIIFTDEDQCLNFLTNGEVKQKIKLFLIVSGSLGKNFVPKINSLSQIVLIYIFCGRKSHHQYWANAYEKIKGVFDRIDELCESLRVSKCFWDTYATLLKVFVYTPKQFSLPYHYEVITSTTDDLTDRDIQISIAVDDISLNTKMIEFKQNGYDLLNSIATSQTVMPYVHYKQYMEFSDLGIWPCLSVIATQRNEVFYQLQDVIGLVKYFCCIKDCLQHVDDHCDDPHFIVTCGSINMKDLLALIKPQIRSIYVYRPDENSAEQYALSAKHPKLISVLQQVENLINVILLDLSTCVVGIGQYYEKENEKAKANARFHYAYRLHLMIRAELTKRQEKLEHTTGENFTPEK